MGAAAGDGSTRPDGPRRTYRAADARREAIVRAATRMFADEGFHQASLARIAAAAGTSQTNLLHHFKGKDALLLAVLQTRDRADAERFGSADQGLRVLLRHTLDSLADDVADPAMARLRVVTAVAATDPGHPMHRYFERRYEAMRENNARAVLASVALGEVRPGVDADAVGRTIVATAEGLLVQWLMAPVFDLVEQARGHFDDLVAFLGGDGRGLG